MNDLPTQYSKRYKEIDYGRVMYLFDYHPWNEGANPRIDNITHTILNTKNSSLDRRRSAAINYFSKVILNKNYGLVNLIDGEPCVFAVVPSHTAGGVSSGLIGIVNNIREAFKFTNADNVLLRHTTVRKAATGGAREEKIHLESIRVVGDVEERTVYLFDDITTTGSSLEACKKLLLKAGARRVAMIALGQTYLEF